ncbi:hypothetical protein [Burkholderia pseudomallei]|uniref:hypothetical protein n=1 Tax=Burkholderia pseudomallei TaxID=28450 RepID=UPI000976F7EA|nr:hypothetical protein [Burkholderia pseudomallei]
MKRPRDTNYLDRSNHADTETRFISKTMKGEANPANPKNNGIPAPPDESEYEHSANHPGGFLISLSINAPGIR